MINSYAGSGFGTGSLTGSPGTSLVYAAPEIRARGAVVSRAKTKKNSFGLIALLLAGLVTLLLPPTMVVEGQTMGVWSSLVATSLITVGIVLLRPSTKEVADNFPAGLVILIVAATGLAAMRPNFDINSLRAMPVHWSLFVGAYFLAALWTGRGGKPERIGTSIMYASLVISLIAVVEYLTKEYIELDTLYNSATGFNVYDRAFHRAANSFRSISTLGNPLILGTFCAAAAAAGLAQYLRGTRLFPLAVFVISTFGAFASMSRSAWVAIIAASVLSLVAQRKVGRHHRSVVIVHAVLAIGCLLVALGITSVRDRMVDTFDNVVELGTERFSELEGSVSFTHRMEVPMMALDAMSQDPHAFVTGFGIGGENAFFFDRYATNLTGKITLDLAFLRTFDNTFLTLFFCLGLTGVFWFGWQLRSLVDLCRLGDPENLWHAGTMLSVLICACFYNIMATPAINLLFAVLLGSGSRLARNRLSNRKPPRSPVAI